MKIKPGLILVVLSMIALTGIIALGRGPHADRVASSARHPTCSAIPHVVAARVAAHHGDSQKVVTNTKDPDDLPEESLARETRRELNRARSATARYHDLSLAIADGHADINVFFPNMGFHYLKSTILDAQIDPERPELLVYAQDLCEGRMRLVAVEYAVPMSMSPDGPPDGFTGEADEWHRNEQFGLWTLHAWIWFKNPDGVFTAFNPRVP